MARTSNRIAVKIEDGFPEYARAIDKAIQDAMTKALKQAEQVAQAAETPRRSGDLHRSIHVIPPKRTRRGWYGAIGASDWKAVFFEKGTKAHKNTERGHRSLTESGRARRKAAGLVSGVKGYRFLRKGIYSVKAEFLRDLRHRIERINP